MAKQTQVKKTSSTRRALVWGGVVAAAAVAIGVVPGISMALAQVSDEIIAAADADVDITWYTEDPGQSEYWIENAAQLRGLAALVNGTAVDDAGQAIGALDFAGVCIYQDSSFALSQYDAANNTIYPVEFTPIGTPEHPFAGTYDGSDYTLEDLTITTQTSNVGLFGYCAAGSLVENVELVEGSCAKVSVTTSTELVRSVGSLVGYSAGSIDGCTSNISVSITSNTKATASQNYVVRYGGGLAGYVCGDITDSGYDGELDVLITTPTALTGDQSEDLRVGDSFGGVVGRFGDPDNHGTISNCYNEGDLWIRTTGSGSQDRFGTTTYANTFWVGGIAGYSNGSILSSHNGTYNELFRTSTARISTSAQDAIDGDPINNRGADSTGGICGGLRSYSDDPDKYNDGDPADQMLVADCYNEGQVTGLVASGGIVGETGVYCTITRCYNGTVSSATDWTSNQVAGKLTSTRWNKPLSGGICGVTRSGTISYCANYAEVRNIQTGYYMAGIAGCIFTSDDYPGVTGEIYSCLNTGGIYTINESTATEYREAGICGDNEGYVHDCIMLEGCVPYHSDSAIGNMDWGVYGNLFVKSAGELASADSAALLNALASQSQDWSQYWFINRTGYPVLNSWVSLSDSDRIELTADSVASVTQIVPAPYVGKDAVTIPTMQVTLSDGTVLVQNTDFYVVGQEGAYEMSATERYTCSIVGIGLYRGTMADCGKYSIGASSLDDAQLQVGAMGYNFGKVVFPTNVSATINGATIAASEFDYVVYASGVNATTVKENKSGKYAAFDSAGYISYDAAGAVKIPLTQVSVAELNAETRDWWLWDRNGEKISDSAGNVYYTSTSRGGTVGVKVQSSSSCVNLQSGTPAGYVVQATAKSDSTVLTGSTIGYYVINPISLYTDVDLVQATVQGETWLWDADASEFYQLDEEGQRIEGMPAATFTGSTIEPDVQLIYPETGYQLEYGSDYRVVNGDPDPSEEDVIVDDSNPNRNVTTYGEESPTRAAITIRPVDTANMSNYVIAYFAIEPADFADCDVSLAQSRWAYTGSAIEPAITVKLNGVRLKAGVDYEVTYANNVEKGTATYTVTPLANLSGGSMEPVTGTFEIDDGVDVSTLSVGEIEDVQYNYGYDVNPKLVFYDAAGKEVELERNVDYTVSYSTTDVTKCVATMPDGKSYSTTGTPCTATITGIGLCTGTLTATFHIVPYNATDNATNQLRAVTQDMAWGTWAGQTNAPQNMGLFAPVVGVQAYPIVDWDAYEAGDMDAAYGSPITLSYANNNTYGGTCNRAPVTYRDAQGNIVSYDGAEYKDSAGNAVTPTQAQPGEIFATVNMRVGTSGSHNGAVGVLAVAEPINYTAPADLATCVSFSAGTDSPVYDGTAKTPITASTSGAGFLLVEGEDYTIEYSNNVDAGVASYVATAIEGGYYTGTASGQFSILQASVAEAIVDPIAEQPYTGQPIEPDVHVTTAEGVALVAGVDYTCTYLNNTEQGEATVYINGIGNYTGRTSATFTIGEPAPELYATVTTEPAAVGTEASFFCETNVVDATYRWQYRKTETGKWIASSADSATQATFLYKLLPVNLGYAFRCVVTGADGTVIESEPITSQTAEVYASVTTDPVAVGYRTLFTVDTNAYQATYQWQYRKGPDRKWITSADSTATTAQLNYRLNDANTAYEFRCLVTDYSGTQIYTDPIGFEISEEAPHALAVVTSPATEAKQIASFTGSTNLEGASLQWQYSKNGGGKWVNSSTASAKTENFTYKRTATNGEYLFRLKVTSPNGATVVYSDPVSFEGAIE